jgi:acetylornithine/succinyldiaminopimelate/putrescine aminotransferase
MFYRDMFSDHIRIVRGEGVYIYDESGKRYLDASGGSNASIPIGHGVKPVIDAMVEQARKVAFVPMHLFSNEPAEVLADQIAKIAPTGLTTTWFVNSGSEAADNAVAGVAPLGSLIVGAEDDTAGATGGAEQRRHGLGQEVHVAERRYLRRGVGTQTLAQARRVTGIVERQG